MILNKFRLNKRLVATELKDKIRRGWKIWNIDRERVESVAEHIYGTCILAISIDSEFELDIDIYKVVMMIVLHEIEEIESMKTKESTFAKMCDKLEADIQCKLYCEENCIDINKKENEHLLKDSRVQKLLKNGEKTVADLYIENDRPRYTEKVFENIADYIKQNNLLKLKEENM